MSSVDLDQWWQRLSSAALVGTARRPPVSIADLNVPGGGALRARPGARAEEAALDAAAIGGALRRAGRIAATAAQPAPVAPAEHLPEAPARAAVLLDLLLHQPPTDPVGTESLLLHWYAVCGQVGRRVPHRLLPAVLDLASTAQLRSTVPAVMGERGSWLAGQNPAWAWASRAAKPSPGTGDSAGAGPVDAHAWALLSTDERVSQLRRLRANDAAAGRDLLLSSWSSDSAKDRRTLLETLAVNLGPGDEDLLEATLDDRAASVRELAAHLLDALPGSRRASRMADRLRPLVKEAGLLRRHLEVQLPDDPDAAGRRDGLGKPPPGRSARGWWLQRIAAGAPFEAWGAPAAKVVPRLNDQDALAGLRRAAQVRGATEWARALLDLGMVPDLVAVLPPQERESRVLDQLWGASPTAVPALLTNLPQQWSAHASTAVVDRLSALKPEEVGPVLEAVMPRLVRGLHADAIPPLQTWRSRAQLPRRLDDKLGSLIQSRTLRQTISEAFTHD